MIRLFQTGTDDPYINLAIEAKLFRERQRAVFLWQNRPSVIAGRNQNLYAEADLSFAAENGILPVRRTTGGGCVYHDRGNLNYSLILPETELETAAEMIVKILSITGIDVKISGRNDLLVSGRKCGGTAWQTEDGWALFHGTILIDTDPEMMRRVLRPAKLKLASKGIASVRARIINLKEADPSVTAESIISAFEQFFGCEAETILPDEGVNEEAEMLRTDRWIYGECCDYQAIHDFRMEQGILRVCLSVHDGLIEEVSVSHDFMDADAIDAEDLKGMLYSPDQICDKITALMKGKGLHVQI